MDSFFVMGGRFVFWVALGLALMLGAAHFAIAQPFVQPPTADNPCGFATPARTPYWDVTSLPAPTMTTPQPIPGLCVPSPIGTGTLPTLRWNKYGLTGWNYCPQPGGKWTTYFAAATWKELSGYNLVSDAAVISAAADPLTTMGQIIAQRVNLPMSDPSLTPVWCPYWEEMVASKPADTVITPPPGPKPPQWVTPATGSFTLYKLVGGKLSSVISGRKAPANAACDCSVTSITVAGSAICPLAAGPADEGTMCKKVAP